MANSFTWWQPPNSLTVLYMTNKSTENKKKEKEITVFIFILFIYYYYYFLIQVGLYGDIKAIRQYRHSIEIAFLCVCSQYDFWFMQPMDYTIQRDGPDKIMHASFPSFLSLLLNFLLFHFLLPTLFESEVGNSFNGRISLLHEQVDIFQESLLCHLHLSPCSVVLGLPVSHDISLTTHKIHIPMFM